MYVQKYTIIIVSATKKDGLIRFDEKEGVKSL